MVEIFETRDATWINYLVSKPENRDTFALATNGGPIDLTEIADRDDYKIITDGVGAFLILDEISPIIFKIHMVFDKPFGVKRSLRDNIEIGHALMQWVWDNTPCITLYGDVPEVNKKARAFARLVGFHSTGIKNFQSESGIYAAEWFHKLRPGTSA